MQEHLDLEATLTRLGGDRELLQELFTAFIEDLPGRMAELQTALDTGDLHTAERRAHSIKGACAAVGAVAARDISAELEQVSLRGEIDRAKELNDSLRERVDVSVSQMKDFKA